MRKLVAFFVLLALFCTSAIHIFAQDATPEATQEAGVAPERPDLLTLLQNDPDGRFTTLIAAIQGSGAATLFDDAGPFTLLAPTNDAFTALETQTGMTQDQLLADRATLTKVLLYHVLPGQYFFRQLTGGPELPTSLLGQTVKFDLTGGVFTVNGANISDPDNLASNGVMIAVDAVLLPPDIAAAMAAMATPEATEAPAAVATEAATPEATVEAGVAPERPDLLTLLQNDPDGRFTTLIAAIQGSGAATLFDDAGPFTLLAPTNDAFTALETQMGMTQDQLLADRATLTKVLLYHVLPGQYFFRQLTGGPELPTSLLGQTVKFDLTGGVFTVNGANISDPDNLASNGVMIAIDAVLLPPDIAAAMAAMATPEATEVVAVATEAPTAVATEAPTAEATQEAGVAPERPDLLTVLQNDPDGRFTTLIAAIQGSGAATLFDDAGPFTLLAPTNDAFTALETQTGMTQDQLLADRATLTKILLYHVLPGQYFFRQLTGGPELPTSLLGQTVKFDLTGGVFTVNGANISDPDNLASNGVMIAIDSVLLPPDIAAALATPEPPAEATEAPTEVATPEATPVATAEAGVPAARPDLLTVLQNDPDGRFTTLLAAIDAAGIADSLQGGPFTLLAPTNDAFTALLTQTGMTQDQLLADKATLTKILLNHVIPGQYFFRQLTGGPTLNTLLDGNPAKFDLTGGVFTVNGANISDPDNVASNGVMIAIDSVIVPPDVAAALPVAATPEPTAEPTEVATATPEVTPEATPVAGGAHIRFVNFSPNASSVDVTVADNTQANLLFGNVSAWSDIGAGSYDVNVTANGDGATASTSVTLGANDWVTVAVTGSAAAGELKATPLVENFTPAASADSARLSVFNGVEGSSSYDVQLDGNTLVILLGYPGTQGANDGFYTVDVPAGTYSIQFVVHNTPSNIVINLPSVSLDAGTNYFIGAAGASAAPGAVIVSSPIP